MSNSLKDLVTKIIASHTLCAKALASGASHANATGILLIEAREQVQTTELSWLDWVQKNCDISIAQVQRYIRIANHWHQILKEQGANEQNLSMAQALQLIRGSVRKHAAPLEPIVIEPGVQIDEVEAEVSKILVDPKSNAPSVVKAFVAKEIQTLQQKILKIANNRRVKVDSGEEIDPAVLSALIVKLFNQEFRSDLVLKTVPKPLAVPQVKHRRFSMNGNGTHKVM